jgi:gliding motility-associated-like protein
LIAYTVNGRQCLVNDTNLTGANIVVSTVLDVNATPDVISTVSGGLDTLSAVTIDPSNSGPYTYTWNAFPGSGVFVPISGPGNFVEYTAGSNNSYVVVTARDNNGCQAYDTVYITLKPCDTTLDSIPNVFTPDNDGRNDQYYITNLCSSEKFHIVIYNRWGKIVYESDDPFFRWDGMTTGGTECSDGTYYYVLALQTKELHGWIELIRNKR